MESGGHPKLGGTAYDGHERSRYLWVSQMESTSWDNHSIAGGLLAISFLFGFFWSYQRHRVVERHNGFFNFARSYGKGFLVIDWKSKNITKEFVVDWERTIYPLNVALVIVLGLTWPMAIYLVHTD
jgi:hypothetical protein